MSTKCGVFHQSYKSEMAIFQTWFARGWMALLFAWMLVFPFVAKPIGKALGTNVLYLANLIGIYIIGAQGLNLLTGYTGQISLGHGAFMGVGAYASAILTMKLGVPFWVALPLSGLIAAVVGMFFGIPSLRLKGLYLAIATMAAQFIIQFAMRNWTWLTGGSDGMSVRAPVFFGLPLNTDRRYYFLVYALVIAGDALHEEPDAQPLRPGLRRDPRPLPLGRGHGRQRLGLPDPLLRRQLVHGRRSPAPLGALRAGDLGRALHDRPLGAVPGEHHHRRARQRDRRDLRRDLHDAAARAAAHPGEARSRTSGRTPSRS